MEKKPTIRFVLITFAISYIAWGIILLAQWIDWFAYGNALSIALTAIAGNSPAIAAYLAKKRERPRLTIMQFLKEAFVFKQKPMVYGLTILFIGLFFVIPALLGAIGSEVPAIIGGTETGAPLPLWLAVIGIPLMFFGGGSEELGWRYYLHPMLEKKISFIPASIAMGLIWSVWHLPLFFIVGTAQYGISPLQFTIMTIGMSFALGLMRKLSSGAFLCVLFHCATNALQGTWPIVDHLTSTICTAAVFMAISIAVVSLGGKQTYRPLANE